MAERVPHQGPFATEREARDAARHIYDSPPGTGAWTDGNRRLLEDACRGAGVELGAFDYRILNWLGGWEPTTCAVIAGLIARAARPAFSDEDRSAVLAALTEAAEAKRDAAALCTDCDLEPDGGLCSTCEWRVQVAGEYDALANRLRGQQ
jgi:hypothetical protein